MTYSVRDWQTKPGLLMFLLVNRFIRGGGRGSLANMDSVLLPWHLSFFIKRLSHLLLLLKSMPTAKFSSDMSSLGNCIIIIITTTTTTSRAVRHRVLKWARFVFCIFIIFLGGGRLLVLIGGCAANMSSLVTNEEVCFVCLTWLYGPFVRTLVSCTNAHAGCGRPTLNFIERFVLGRSLPFRQWSHFTLCQSALAEPYVYRFICRTV